MARHISVLLNETIEALAIKEGGRYVDGTLGRAGHTREILKRGGLVLGIDRDEQALAEVESIRGEIEGAERLTTVKGNHSELAQLARARGWNEAEGVLLDLGVSSPQLDEAERGFSFLREGPLDMRMDRSGGVTAAELVNGESAETLERIFRENGEEPQARRIARAIVSERVKRSGGFVTTKDLADFIERTLGRRGAHHPATRVFQALRMAVNDEMRELERALEGALGLLARGGRLAVITFESLTDRTVKRFCAAHVGKMISLQQGGERWEGEEPRVKAITRKAVIAGDEETSFNPRARSAKLRVIERI